MHYRSSLSAIFPFSPSFALLMMTISTNAQMPPDANLFQWKFSDNFLGTELPSCQSFGIIVEPVNATNVTHGIPPFYMIAWEIGGTPRTTLLGLNESSLDWTVDHPVGSSLMLNVVDSQGNGGGIPPERYTVQSGQSTECVVNNNQSDFTVTANITDSVNTCQPYGLRIHGGVPPYNLSLAQFSSPVVTNVTIPSPQDAFTYINRATPGFLLLAAVSDITGRYAFGTPTIMPTGSEDVSCVGLNSTPGNATLLDEEQEVQAASILKAKNKRMATIAGVLTPLLILIVGGAAFFVYHFDAKRQRMREELAPEPLPLPEPKIVEEARGSLSVGNGVDISPSSGPGSSLNPFITETESAAAAASNDLMNLPSSTLNSGRSSTSSRCGFVNFPSTSIRHPNKKVIEAGSVSSSADMPANSLSPRDPFIIGRSISAQPRGNPLPAMPIRSASFDSYIFQHEDGGRFVREPPPPYERRSRQISDVPQSP
ncbi:hypothetical protein J3R30DRAFT_3694407 [Lentinula aciculospora]|uniref:Uncharacterized protein n=1 Tax=Lentinula aciculospora TaxID=153920 RepID=A0A9W9AWU8_9AGAR|nr:hypothetical protein J3R30DRAFT_3694407 [Lentinula aciculospora]